MEEVDIAIAASRGVTKPATASGITRALYPAAIAKFSKIRRLALREMAIKSGKDARLLPKTTTSDADRAASAAEAGATEA